MHFRFILLFLCFAITTSYAQDYKKIDSLKQILTTLPELNGTDADTTRLKIFINIGNLYKYNNSDSAIFWYNLVINNFQNKRQEENLKNILFLKSKTLFNIGITYKFHNKINLAKENYLSALKIGYDICDTTFCAEILLNLGILSKGIGEYQAAIDFYKVSLFLRKQKNDLKGSTDCINNIGNVLFAQTKYNEALGYYNEALQNYYYLGNNLGIAACLQNIGNIHGELGKYYKAIDSYNSALEIYTKLTDIKGTAICLNNLGNVYSDLGDYPKALNYYEKAQKNYIRLNNLNGIATCYMNLGILFFNQGNFKEALSYYEKSLEIREKAGDKDGVSTCQMNIGILLTKIEKYSEALMYFEMALKIKEEIEDLQGIAYCCNNLGVLAKNLGNLSDAEVYFGRSLQTFKDIGDKQAYNMALLNFGIIYFNKKQFLKAKPFFKQSSSFFEEFNNKSELINIYPVFSKLYFNLHEIDSSYLLLMKSRDISISLMRDNFQIMNEIDKLLYLESMVNIFDMVNNFHLLSTYQLDSLSGICYNNELILKGILLNTSSNLKKQIDKCDNKEAKDSYGLLKYYRNQLSKMTIEDSNDLNIIDSLEQLANIQERNLVKISSSFINAQKQFTYHWLDVQKALHPNEAAIEFVQIKHALTRPDTCKTDSISYAALILKSGIQFPQMIPLCNHESLQKIAGKLGWSNTSMVDAIYKKGSVKGKKLYELIWQPLETYLTEINTIYMAPVGDLNQIAFAAIPINEQQLLGEKYQINMVSSTRVLIGRNTQSTFLPSIENKAVIFGGIQYAQDSTLIKQLAYFHKTDANHILSNIKDLQSDYNQTDYWQHLDGTLTEVSHINRLLAKQKIYTTLYTGVTALEEQFKALENEKSPEIIHIATHGFSFPLPEKQEVYKIYENSFVQNQNPLFRAGLLFAGANRTWSKNFKTDSIEDGVLTAYEVSNMNLQNTQLVVLSACETGLGDIRGSEGVYGLQRAFKMAGVKYIIMSLWQVPDKETVEFMVTFYTKLLKQKDIRKAFTETQKIMQKKYAPYYWAAFVLIE